jgi:hypothetical protein
VHRSREGTKGMKRKPTEPMLYVPTLLDKAGARHIISTKDSAAYCGATGSQHFPHEYKAAELCPRCLQSYYRALIDERMTRLGL